MKPNISRADETTRLSSLHACEILDTSPDPNFDAIIRIACKTLKVPTAAVAFIDKDRQWFKAAIGMFATGTETSRDVAFCSETIRHPTKPLIIEDAKLDQRFYNNSLVKKPGGIRFYAGMPLLDDAGQALGSLCIIDEMPRQISNDDLDVLHDLAQAASVALDLHRTVVDLRASEKRRQAAIELNPQIPWTANADGHILEVSPNLILTLATWNEETLNSSDWTKLIHPDDLPEVRHRREEALRSGTSYDIEHRMRSTDGTWRWFRSFAVPRRTERGEIVLWYGSSEDITERKLSQEKVIQMAFHDGLTGLPNRIKFSDLLDKQISESANNSTAFTLLCVDLDHFKGVNDRLGHLAGDSVLKQIATRLNGCLGPMDILARFGGDEFFIIQPCQPNSVKRIAERVATALSEPLAIEGHVFSITASIGASVYPQDGTEADALFRNADLALHRAKTIGRATCCLFDAAIDEHQRMRLALKLDLQDAINRDEFELAYQPLVNTRTGRIDGFEALLRWRHPSRGWVSPADFISCDEESGMIIPIGEWVMDRACREAARWPSDIRVAVNLSPSQFRDQSLLTMIATCLERSKLPPQRLELEITESVPLLDGDFNSMLLHKLRESGISIALDDFGTGYSSLSYLQRFPFTKLKIDRSLVSRLCAGQGGFTIVRAVIAMGRALGISITAEGVETQEQFHQLCAENCDQIQGYLVSRPVPLSEVLPLIHRFNDKKRMAVTAAAPTGNSGREVQ